MACGKGTYVRSLIDDLGKELGCGAHLAELRRTRSGMFSIEQAQLPTALDPKRILTIESCLHLPAVTTPAELVPFVRSGLQLKLDQLAGLPSEGTQFQLLDPAAKLVAIAHATSEKIVYDRVFVA